MTRNIEPFLNIPYQFRPPIDSVETKLDIVGLFNHCVTVKLADGSIIEQNIYPGSTHCQEIFLQSWKLLLNSQWNQVSKKYVSHTSLRYMIFPICQQI